MHIQFDNPFEVGMTGLLGLPSAYHSMHDADLLILLGTDFPYTPFMPTKNKIVQIDKQAGRLGRRAKLEMGLPDYQTDMVNPDFSQIATAMGFTGLTITQPDKIESGIMSALQTAGPVLVNIITDANALAMPPKVEVNMVGGMALSMGKLMLGGRWRDVVDTVPFNIKHIKEIND